MRTTILATAVLLGFAAAPQAQDAPKAERPAFKVGDSWQYERVNRDGSRLEVRRDIKAVAADALTVVVTDAAGTTEQQWTPELNYMRGEGKRVARPHQQYLSFPLMAGRQWKVDVKGVNASGRDFTAEGSCKVVSFEKVTVKAGTFDAFKVDCDVDFYIFGPGIRGKDRWVYWYAPAARAEVRIERLTRDAVTTYFDWTQELVATTGG